MKRWCEFKACNRNSLLLGLYNILFLLILTSWTPFFMNNDQNNPNTPPFSEQEHAPVHWLEPHVLIALKAIKGWSNFLSICGLIFSGLLVVAGFAAFFGSAFLNSASGTVPGVFPFAFLGIIYIFMGAIYVYPSYQGLQLTKRLKYYLSQGNPQDAINGLFALKNIFAFFGILTAVLLGIYALIIMVGILSVAVFNP